MSIILVVFALLILAAPLEYPEWILVGNTRSIVGYLLLAIGLVLGFA